MIKAYILMWKNSFDFSGRSRRRDYWFACLAHIIILAALLMLNLSFVFTVYQIAAFVPNIALSIRRLHDMGNSGWWLLVGIVPLIGPIALIFFNCSDSVPDNEYGPNPKALS